MDAQGQFIFIFIFVFRLFYFSFGECMGNSTDENYFYSQETRGIGKSTE